MDIINFYSKINFYFNNEKILFSSGVIYIICSIRYIFKYCNPPTIRSLDIKHDEQNAYFCKLLSCLISLAICSFSLHTSIVICVECNRWDMILQIHVRSSAHVTLYKMGRVRWNKICRRLLVECLSLFILYIYIYIFFSFYNRGEKESYKKMTEMRIKKHQFHLCYMYYYTAQI